MKITWHWRLAFGPPLPAYVYIIKSEPFIVGVPTEWPSARRACNEGFVEAGLPLEDAANALGYSDDFPLRTDRSVTFWRSKLPPSHSHFPEQEILLIDHSRIEYIWVKR